MAWDWGPRTATSSVVICVCSGTSPSLVTVLLGGNSGGGNAGDLWVAAQVLSAGQTDAL